jgi:radical SAM superfamily enzyme YgiQ (UPF0313 family)
MIKSDSFFGFLLPSLALERLAAAVEDIAACELFDMRFEKNMIDKIAAFSPDIVCLNVKTTLYSAQAYAAAKAIKSKMPGVKIIAGGLHASICPLEAVSHCDFVIRGEGERGLREFIEGAPLESIGGLVYRDKGEVIINEMSAPAEDMDLLKPPARHLRKPYYNYSAAGLMAMDLLETSRGCTHCCSFCSPASVYPGKYRAHSPQYVMSEVKKLSARGVKYCMLTDDHFGGDPARVEKICDLIIESGIKIAFFCFIRPFAGETALKKKMVKAGFVMVSYGAESPDPAQLNRYGKGFGESGEFIKQVNREWLEAGACYVGNSFVFGDVNDSAALISSLGVFARGLDPTYIEPLYSQPFAGTRYRQILEEGDMLVKDRGWDYFTEGRMLVKHPELNEEELKKLRAKMWVDFFSPRKACGVFRVPLYFYQTLKIPVTAILKYMRACDYSVFGCILEDKFYKDLYYSMIDDYFGRALLEFPPHELDMTENFDAFTDMAGLSFFKRILENYDIVIYVYGPGKSAAASLDIKIRNRKIIIAKVIPRPKKNAAPPCSEKIGRINFYAPLRLLKPAMAADTRAVKTLFALMIVLYNAFFSNFAFKFSAALLNKIIRALFAAIIRFK